jgi:hypothetical protein
MSPVEIAAAAQELINASGIAGVTVLRLVKKGASLQQCSFEFTDGTNSKAVALSAFMRTPSFVRKNAKVIPTGTKVQPLEHSKAGLDVELAQKRHGRGLAYYESKFYEVFSHEDLELVEYSTQTGFLVRIKRDGGFLRRYKSFAQVLEYDPNFNRANNGPYYMAQAIMEAGYEVELEFTLPNTRYRFDMAVWTPDRKRLIGFIEHDGIQHQQKVGQFGDTDETLNKRKAVDKTKEDFAAAIGIPLYRVIDPGGQWTRDVRESAKATGRKLLEELLKEFNS